MSTKVIEAPSERPLLAPRSHYSGQALTIAQGMSPKALLIKHLAAKTPRHQDFGIPEYIYRSDLLPASFDALDELEPAEQEDTIANARVELDFTQGFPTLYNADPLWSKWPFEPQDAFRTFTQYLDMPRGESYTDGLSKEPISVRQLHLLQTISGKSLEEIHTLANTYYWFYRAPAYDAFVIATHSKMKEHRLIKAECDHYTMAREFVDTARTHLTLRLKDAANKDDPMATRELLEIIKYFTQLERLSVGAQPFSAGNPHAKDPNALPANSSIEVIMSTLFSQSGQLAQPVLIDQAADITNKLYENSEDLGSVQEIIIRAMEGNAPRKNRVMNFDSTVANDPALTGSR